MNFQSVSRDLKRKIAIAEAPLSSDAAVQDLGNETQSIKFDCFFTGDDYDTVADAFFSALSEKGVAAFSHPRYGDIAVIPSSWAQSEDLVEGLGRANFSIEFIKINRKIRFPATLKSTDGEIVVKSSAAIAASIDKTGSIVPDSARDFARIKEFIVDSTNEFFIDFDPVLSASQDALSSALSVSNEILDKIDVLISDPIELYSKMSTLLSIPALVITKCSAKVFAYLNHIKSISSFIPESYAQARTAVEMLFYAAGFSSQASIYGEYSTRVEVVESSDNYGEILASFFTKIEDIESEILDFLADVETSSAVVNAVSIARDALIDRAFALKAEKRITLKSQRTPIDLLFELTGSIDSLDEFILNNKLSGNEIVLIPPGRQVSYYE